MHDVAITIFYLVSNGRFFLSLNDVALVILKDKVQKDTVYVGQTLGAKELELHKNVRYRNCGFNCSIFKKPTIFFGAQKREQCNRYIF
jgi:hypothetical protein